MNHTVSKALRLMSRGEISSAELTAGLLERIKQQDGELGAFLWLDEKDAMKRAREADDRRRQGDARPLLGLPVAVKDLLNVEGQPCTCASRILEGYTAPYDATVVARLRSAGAFFLGRTNMDEFAMGATSETSAFRTTRNPVSPEHVPGGSSGGSAAAVAAGMALAALGTDTGGSIRQPAAFCGCVGLKPTYGRVSRYGAAAFASSLDQIGPMTGTVYDAALILNVIAGHDPLDATSLNIPVPDYAANLTRHLEGVRIGMPREYFANGVDQEVSTAVRAAAAACERLGARVCEVSLPHADYAVAVYQILSTAEASANLARYDGIRYGKRAADSSDPASLYRTTRARYFGAEVQRRIILGTYVLCGGYYDAYYQKALKARTLIAGDFERAFAECDVLLAPVSPCPPCKIGENINDPLKMYLMDIFTVSANLAGICGISVPCGATRSGLPIGLQILGPAMGEPNILRVGYAYRASQPGTTETEEAGQ